MASLSASRLKTAMKSALDAIDVDNGSITNDAALDAICGAIVDEVQTYFIDAVYNIHTQTTAGTVTSGAGAGGATVGLSAVPTQQG